MNRYLTPYNIFILLAFIYIIITVERLFNSEINHTQSLIEYQKDKMRMQEEISVLENKNHNYEKLIIQNSIDILNMSTSERDSARNVLNPR